MEQLLIQKILCTYLTLLLDSAHQILHRGEEPDPDNSADGSYRQSWRWSGVTSRCSQEGSSAIFASSGASQNPVFSASRANWQPAETFGSLPKTPAKGFGSLPIPKPRRGRQSSGGAAPSRWIFILF